MHSLQHVIWHKRGVTSQNVSREFSLQYSPLAPNRRLLRAKAERTGKYEIT